MPDPAPYAVVLCARANSERLPNKALAELAPGVTVLAQLLQRWRQSDRAPTLILATPEGAVNDPLAAVAAAHGVPVSRSAPGNAVAEMDAAIRRYCPDAAFVARALADNPLVDVALADWRLDVLAETGADGLWYGPDHNRITYAGTTDVWSRAAWDIVAAESKDDQYEHPGKYFWDNLDKFSVIQIPLPRREYLRLFRTELDTLRDLEMFQAVWAGWDANCEGLGRETPSWVPTLWALKWLAEHMQIAAINSTEQVKTATKPKFGNRRPWHCKTCNQPVGHFSGDDLKFFCPGCGQRVRFRGINPKKTTPDMGWVP